MDLDRKTLQEADDQIGRALDYNEEQSVEELHSAVLRERPEPVDGMEPVPLWLITFFCLVIFWSGGYFAYYCGGFRADVFDESMVTWGPVSGGAAQGVDPIAKGRSLFIANCSACHQSSGEGLPGQYPSLHGSEQVTGAPNRLAMLVLNGLEGPVENKGITYNGNMPAQKLLLKDQQISYILTYIRQEWGNGQGPITPEGVKAMRDATESRVGKAFTWPELKAIPAQDLPSGAVPATAAPAAAKP
jgi:mono/diheme cytochrome c family protein